MASTSSAPTTYLFAANQDWGGAIELKNRAESSAAASSVGAAGVGSTKVCSGTENAGVSAADRT